MSAPLLDSTSTSIRTAIINVRIFDGSSISELRTIVIADELIVDEIEGHDAHKIDGNGGILVPGFIDSHVHLTDEHDLQQMASYGVTTALDMATWPVSKLTPLRHRKGMTDIRSAGLPATSRGSFHSAILPFTDAQLVNNYTMAEEFVADRVSEGADYIKVIADIPGPDQETLNAIVAAAHRREKLVVAHAAATYAFAMAQEARADIITHVPVDQPLSKEAISLMVVEKCISVPTLTMMDGATRPPSWWQLFHLLLHPLLFWSILQAKRKRPYNGAPQKYEHARASVAALYAGGVPILAGTDANSADGSPFNVRHGVALHDELERLVEAGLSNVDALRAATVLPATYFGLNDRGVIEVGKRADLVLLAENPLENIRATRSIRRVWCTGIETRSFQH